MLAALASNWDIGMQIDWSPISRIPELQAFIDAHWRRRHILARDSSFLRWQYRHSGDADCLSVLVAQRDERVLGLLGLIQVDFCRYGERLPAMWLALWFTAPNVRGRVGLALLREAFRRDCKMIGCLGVNETAKRIYAALRFDIWEAIPRWVRVVSPLALESLLAEHAELYPSEVLMAWCAKAQLSTPPATVPIVRLVDWGEETAERWDWAWQEQFAPRLLGTWRDAEYLRWRYVDHPHFRYVLRFAENTASGALIGLLVYRVETVRDREEKVLRVVEFLSAERAGGALVRAILDAGEAANVAFADFYCTSAAFAVPLEAAGFVREERMSAPLPTLFQPLDLHRMRLNGAFWVAPTIANNSRTFFRTQSLYVTKSDGDQDRPN